MQKRRNQLGAADWYRTLSMAYATGAELPAKAKNKPKIGTRAERRLRACQQSATKEKLQMAEELRRKMTPAEVHLWKILSKLNSREMLIESQVVIGGYIADFCCFKYRLVIEVDGPIHDSRKEYDALRDYHLRRRGYRTLRFTNDEVFQNRALVIGKIMEAL
jgi:very-short-patch-repair endonuclease